ncbi:MAG: TlpA family protein disulfide reductase [Syntrophobacterales bacterium]|nr:TlpA family protein disulfide reductase [Syntrophobacterales bacterium]
MEEKRVRADDGYRFKHIIFFVFIIIAAAVFILFQGKDSFFTSHKPRVKVGMPAPNFTFPGLDGKNISLADFKGKVVFVNIWATWCPPCREEMPSMEKLHQELKGKDFEILAVSIDTAGAAAVAPFMKEYKLSFPALLDPEGRIKNLYGTTGVPESFIVNKEGLIEEIVIGPRDWFTPEVVRFFRNLIQRP